MKRYFWLLVVLFVHTALAAVPGGDEKGALTPEIIRELRSSFTLDATTRSALNAVSQNDIKALALDRMVSSGLDKNFSHRIETEGVTNQQKSGRCSLFAGLNIMRPIAARALNVKMFEFSQNYLFFWDKLEKANLFLESIIRTADRPVSDREVEWLLKHPFPDGGQWNMVLSLVKKYGAVPKDVMPESKNSTNTGNMNKMISRLLRKDAAILRDLHAGGASPADLEKRKLVMLKEVYRMLALHLGVPPTSFTWRYKDKSGKLSEPRTYTPREFLAATVNLKLDDYVCLHNIPGRTYNRLYQIQFDRDMMDQPNMTFVNVPMETLADITRKSILADEPVWFGCDVGKESNSKLGFMKRSLYDYDDLYGVDFDMTKEERIWYQESVPTHAMVITGVDLRDDKPVKWLVENSWGSKVGEKGYFTMYDDWFREYTYSIVVNKKFVPDEVLKLFTGKAEMLPPWDPMFAMEWQ